MPADDESRELVPGIIATIVAAIGAFCAWSDLRSDSFGHRDGMTTSAVVSRARCDCGSVGIVGLSGGVAAAKARLVPTVAPSYSTPHAC